MSDSRQDVLDIETRLVEKQIIAHDNFFMVSQWLRDHPSRWDIVWAFWRDRNEMERNRSLGQSGHLTQEIMGIIPK